MKLLPQIIDAIANSDMPQPTRMPLLHMMRTANPKLTGISSTIQSTATPGEIREFAFGLLALADEKSS